MYLTLKFLSKFMEPGFFYPESVGSALGWAVHRHMGPLPRPSSLLWGWRVTQGSPLLLRQCPSSWAWGRGGG